MENTPSQEIHQENTAAPIRPWGIGGSDIGAILGLSTYKQPLDVWKEKLGLASALEKPIHLRFGQHLESFIAEEYERVTGWLTHEHPQTVHHPEHPQLFAHVDRLVTKDQGVATDAKGKVVTPWLLECKTANAFTANQWGNPGTDQVPDAYLVQCIWYTTLTGCQEAHLAVLLGNHDFRIYKIPHNQELGSHLIEAALSFWNQHVLNQVPPKPTSRQGVLALYPVETLGLSVEAQPHTVLQLKRLKRLQKLAKSIETTCEKIKDQLAIHMGPAERICSNGKSLATWKSGAPISRVDVTRLRQERPDIANDYTVVSPSPRRLVLGD